MISDVDDALRALLRAEPLAGSEVDVVFDAPTKDWSARRSVPTIDLYLYDIREDLRRRERGWHEVTDDDGVVVARKPLPRHFKLSYLVTAWTQRPEDEHRLLSALLRCFIRHEAMPQELVIGTLAETGLPVPMTVALPPPEDRAFADVWSALGGELKPSLDLVVVAALDTGVVLPAGPPVEEGVALDMQDRVGGGVDEGRHRHRPSTGSQPAGPESAKSHTSAADRSPRPRSRKATR